MFHVEHFNLVVVDLLKSLLGGTKSQIICMLILCLLIMVRLLMK